MSEEFTTPDLVERTHRSFAAANRRDWDEVMGFFAHDAVWEVPELQAFDGQDAIRGFLEDWVGAYRDVDIEVEDFSTWAEASRLSPPLSMVGSRAAQPTCASASEPPIDG